MQLITKIGDDAIRRHTQMIYQIFDISIVHEARTRLGHNNFTLTRFIFVGLVEDERLPRMHHVVQARNAGHSSVQAEAMGVLRARRGALSVIIE